MKTLQEILEESLLDDFSTISKNNIKQIKNDIKTFLKTTYNLASKYKISDEPNKDGKFVVNVNKDVSINEKIKYSIQSLTNDFFVFGEIQGNFKCNACTGLKSLEGAPKKLSGDFECCYCHGLTDLTGAPESCRYFDCSNCRNLTSLEGAPKTVFNTFFCRKCGKLFTEEEVKKVCNARYISVDYNIN